MICIISALIFKSISDTGIWLLWPIAWNEDQPIIVTRIWMQMHYSPCLSLNITAHAMEHKSVLWKDKNNTNFIS